MTKNAEILAAGIRMYIMRHTMQFVRSAPVTPRDIFDALKDVQDGLLTGVCDKLKGFEGEGLGPTIDELVERLKNNEG